MYVIVVSCDWVGWAGVNHVMGWAGVNHVIVG